MNNICVFYQPFSMNQKIIVYDSEGKTIESKEVSIDRVIDCTRGLASKYGTSNVTLHGSKEYLLKFKEEFATKYNTLNVTIF